MKVKPIENQEGAYIFNCPGCKSAHKIDTKIWAFNNDFNKPTVSPSVLVRTGHYIPDQQDKPCWCTYRKEHPELSESIKCSICHSFVKDGKIQFLSDCTHELAGQTVELPEL